MTNDTKTERQPNWQPEQMETDDPGSGDDTRRDEISGGLRGGRGPTWNKGSMPFDNQRNVPPSEMKESEKGPWGSADQAERAAREQGSDR
jgi:hypothetical protein